MDDISTNEDVRSLKVKRGTRKGLITRISNHVKVIIDKPLPSIRESDLQKNLSALDDHIRWYEALQMRLEELEYDYSTAEDREVTEQRTFNDDLRTEISKLLDAIGAWEEACVLEDAVTDIESMASLVRSTGRDAYRTLTQNHLTFRKALRKVPGRPELIEASDKLEPAIRLLRDRYDREMADAEPAIIVPSSPAVAPPAPPSRSRLKTELPTFSGDILKWRDFWRVFEPLMEKETDLSDPEKISHLIKSMKEGSARTEAEIAAGAHDSYADVVTHLKSRFDQPRTVFRGHVAQLGQTKTIQYTRHGLMDALSHLSVHQTGLERQGGWTATQYLTAQIESHMSDETLTRWNEYSTREKAPPTFDLLKAFLLEKADTMCPTSRPFRPTSAPPKARALTIRPARAEPEALDEKHPQSSSRAKCSHCTGQHPTFTCQLFRSLPVDKREEAVMESGACRNCLAKGHRAARCPSRNSCRTCDLRHHTLLHRPSNSSARPPVKRTPSPPPADDEAATGASYCAKPRRNLATIGGSLSHTVRATVVSGCRQKTVRAFMDTGSSVTLITSRLANDLQARRRRCDTSITGLGGKTISRDVVTLTIVPPSVSTLDRHTFEAHVVDRICDNYQAVDIDGLTERLFVKGLPLADPQIGEPGRVELLLSLTDCNGVSLDGQRVSADKKLIAIKTIFGWAVGGTVEGRSAGATESCLKISAADQSLTDALQQLWRVESVPGEGPPPPPEEQQALQHFEDTIQRRADGRYAVQLPRRSDPPPLGDSRNVARRRLAQNERSLTKKGTWNSFAAGVREYIDLGHAEEVPREEVVKPDAYYLPMHGVAKETSTTTKLRIVFDASARTTSGTSLNDILLPGPSLHPKINSIINKFRLHPIAMSADISKMFREVELQQSERDLHRFLVKEPDGCVKDYRMTRLTFGVTCSPFIASRVLLQVAEDHGADYPLAAKAIREAFYVDDCLTGAATVAEAAQICQELNEMLQLAGMTLRKWRSSSQELLDGIPPDRREKSSELLSVHVNALQKALGIHWNTDPDVFHVATPHLDPDDPPTKRQIASDVAKVFDILGWYSPAVMTVKILLQRLWSLKLGWDETVPPDIQKQWRAWRSELPLVTSNPIPRCLLEAKTPVSVQLHGYSDASQHGYGGVIYLRVRYSDTSVSVRLVTSKTRVAPISPSTIPRLELGGAHLLAKLLSTTAKDLQIESTSIYAWTDSSVVIGWLNMTPSRLKSFVSHRVTETLSIIPAAQWRYVATEDNPADLASRGSSPKHLLQSKHWWEGPPWLNKSPADWPHRPDINGVRELPELRERVLVMQPTPPEFGIKFSSLGHLQRTIAWLMRFIHNTSRPDRRLSPTLTKEELDGALHKLLELMQRRFYSVEIDRLQAKLELPKSSTLNRFNPFLDDKGLVRVGGRLQKSPLGHASTHPVVLHRSSHLAKLLVRALHKMWLHVGTSTMLALLSAQYAMVGAKGVVKSVCSNCVPCRRVNAQTATQIMAPLPTARVTPTPPFHVTGVDYAGPFLYKCGPLRRSPVGKAYAAVFVCLSTKAVHLDLVTELSTKAFVACFERFIARRGCPSCVYSDNGTNFVGADRQLQQLQEFVTKEATAKALHDYAAGYQINWVYSPGRAPHFGGLWEAAVKSMKRLLKKTVGVHTLTFEELTTILASAEAILNSRPLAPLDSLPDDGIPVLTSGHFLIGRALRAPPSVTHADSKVCNLRRWNLRQKLDAELWERWYGEYLQTLQTRHRWGRTKTDLKAGDVVLIRDAEMFPKHWPLARVVKTYPGSDGHTRVVDVKANGHVYRRAIHRLVPLLCDEDKDATAPSSAREDVRASSSPSAPTTSA